MLLTNKLVVCAQAYQAPSPATLPASPIYPRIRTAVGPDTLERAAPSRPFASLPPLGPVEPLPPDDIPDVDLPTGIAARRAEELYPLDSGVTRGRVPTIRQTFTQAAQRQFKAQLNEKDPRILAKLSQPYGKDNLTQCYTSEAAFRHVLLPLWWSGFLYQDVASWEALTRAYYPAKVLDDLLTAYSDVDFTDLKGFPPGWETESEVNQDRVAMATAAAMLFNGSIADLVRWIGGPHVNEHLDKAEIVGRIQRSGAPATTVQHVSRILTSGIPNACNASGTEANFKAYYSYGNHSTVDEVPEKTYKALVKDNKKGYTLLLDERFALFALHCHLTPQGIVDLNTKHKNPRPIFDSSFHPEVWAQAINDLASKDTEPPLTFAGAELGFMIWLYNLRITYPDLEIYIADDDISGAYRRMKYHPNLMALHASIQCGYLVINTGGTFGDNTSPSNFDPLALSRRFVSRYVWMNDPNVVERMSPSLPPITTVPADPTVQYVQADADGLNRGVLDANGERLPPSFDMHVDDSLYADIDQFLARTVCSSVAGLELVFGNFDDIRVPKPLSDDKFESVYTHIRRLVGRLFNSRNMTVGILPYKLEQLRDLLLEWKDKRKFQLLELARLLGILENHTRYARWARYWFFALQNGVRAILLGRFHFIKRTYPESKKIRAWTAHLPANLLGRIDVLLSRDKAQLLWSTRQHFPITADIRESLDYLLHYVTSSDSPWEVPLGLIVPREPHFASRGDASHVGGGAYSPELRFWLEIAWSKPIIKGATRIKPGNPGYIHINTLEFIVLILQLAAINVRLESTSPDVLKSFFPQGVVPNIPVWFGETDNTASKSWENRATASSRQAQGLVAVYAELLRTTLVQTMCEHIAGELNVIADSISRSDFSLPVSVRWQKLFLKHPSLGTYDFFQPSPDLLQLLTLQLFSKSRPVPLVLPPVLGHFLPAGSITSSSVVL